MFRIKTKIYCGAQADKYFCARFIRRAVICALLLLAFDIYHSVSVWARSANTNTGVIGVAERERIDDEIESLKFRINELTREVALLKTAFMRLSGPRQSADPTNNYEKSAIAENSNYISVKSDKSQSSEIISVDRKNSNQQRQNSAKTGGTENSGQRQESGRVVPDLNNSMNLNIIYESRPSVAKPLVYSVFSNEIRAGKNLKIMFSFDKIVLFMSAISSNNLKLLSQNSKSREFIFQITDYTKTSLKLAFSAASIGEMNSQMAFFEDTNKNNMLDVGESRGQRDLYQTIILEE